MKHTRNNPESKTKQKKYCLHTRDLKSDKNHNQNLLLNGIIYFSLGFCTVSLSFRLIMRIDQKRGMMILSNGVVCCVSLLPQRLTNYELVMETFFGASSNSHAYFSGFFNTDYGFCRADLYDFSLWYIPFGIRDELQFSCVSVKNGNAFKEINKIDGISWRISVFNRGFIVVSVFTSKAWLFPCLFCLRAIGDATRFTS